MSKFLGFDTSNYTTSVALFDESADKLHSCRKILEVKKGSLGLRQSDALFLHTGNLADQVELLLRETSFDGVSAVAASDRPRDVEGSYMPCFLAGMSHGRTLSLVLGVPFYTFSHQQGHLAAGAKSADRIDLLERDFLALHVSGGTTEVLHITAPSDRILTAKRIGGSTDLAAGQLIDRCGKLLGLGFPSGPELEVLAQSSDSSDFFVPRSRGLEFSLSGLENKVNTLNKSQQSSSNIASFVIKSIIEILSYAIREALSEFPGLPILCVGGVMANVAIRNELQNRFGCVFATPQLSSDNAAGTALLCYLKNKRGGH